MAKGSKFEREICKQLSRWWSHGQRDDIFWRSSISGGRATVRGRKGLKTFGAYGDIAAVDPVGAPLLQLFTIELKCGRTYRHAHDLLDQKRIHVQHPFLKCVRQAIRCAKEAGSLGWLLIIKRDWREPLVYMDVQSARLLDEHSSFLSFPSVTRFDLSVPNVRWRIVAMQLSSLLVRVLPGDVRHCLAKRTKASKGLSH